MRFFRHAQTGTVLMAARPPAGADEIDEARYRAEAEAIRARSLEARALSRLEITASPSPNGFRAEPLHGALVERPVRVSVPDGEAPGLHVSFYLDGEPWDPGPEGRLEGFEPGVHVLEAVVEAPGGGSRRLRAEFEAAEEGPLWGPRRGSTSSPASAGTPTSG